MKKIIWENIYFQSFNNRFTLILAISNPSTFTLRITPPRLQFLLTKTVNTSYILSFCLLQCRAENRRAADGIFATCRKKEIDFLRVVQIIQTLEFCWADSVL